MDNVETACILEGVEMSEIDLVSCPTLAGYAGFATAVVALAIYVIRMRTKHHHQSRKNRELDARRRVRDRDSAIADGAADELLGIGEERRATAQAVGDWKLVLLGLALALAFLAWRLSSNV